MKDKQMWRDIKKWLIIIGIWIFIIICSLIFIDWYKGVMLGIWCLVTGGFMYLMGNRIDKWADKYKLKNQG